MRDAGTVTICELMNISDNGAMPVQVLMRQSRYWFEIRTIGVARQYQAKGVSEQVDLLIRIPYDESIRIGQYAVLGDGSQFVIDNATMVIDDDGLKQTEITLRRLDKHFDVRRRI